jgi:hypothetical protein
MLGSSGSLNMCLPANAGTLKQNWGMRTAAHLFHQTANARSRAAIEHYLITVNIEPRTPDLPTF